MCLIVEDMDISHSSVILILNDHVGMRNLFARNVPHLLIIDHKRVTNSKECLMLFNRNPNESLLRFIIVKETFTTHLRSTRGSEGDTVSQQRHGDTYLKCTRNNPHRWPPKWKNNHWRISRQLIGPAQWRFKENTTPMVLAKKQVPLHPNNTTHTS